MHKIAIILPCYNEELIVKDFYYLLVKNLKSINFYFEVIFINDGSTDNTRNIISSFSSDCKNLNLTLLDIHFNIGHQSAIYQSFLYIKDLNFDNILIMDSDGEDDPYKISEILKLKNFDLVQVSRGKRRERLFFKIMYKVYKFIYFVVLGKKINFGNFCLINNRLVLGCLHKGFDHLGSFLDNQKCKKTNITIDRKKRLGGVSKMNFKSLFNHSINSFIENSESLLFFQLKVALISVFLFLLVLVVIIYKKYILEVAIPGWSSVMISSFFILMFLYFGLFVNGYLTKKNTQNNILIRPTLFVKHIIFKNWK